MKFLTYLSLAFLPFVLLAASNHGPGMPQRSYTQEQLFETLGVIESSKPGVRGHAAMLMFKGYLVGVEARDSGEGDGVIAFFDVSDPANPQRVASYEDEHTKVLFEGHTYGFTVIDGRDIVFLIGQSGLQIWDWTDIFQIKHLHSMPLPMMTRGAYNNTAWWLTIQYPYIYVGGTNTGLHIIDASDLDAPELVNRIPMEKLGGFPIGSLYACGNLLVCNTFDRAGFSVLDISDPVKPELVQVLKEDFGYSCLFNGGYLYGIGERPKIWDLHDPENVKLVGEYTGPTVGSKGGYGFFQDGFLHQGASGGYAKIDVRDPSNPTLVRKVERSVKQQDFDGAHVVGNHVIMTCDHGTGSHIFAHQTEPDTVGPEVNFMSPAPESVNNHPLSRIGFTFSDEVNHDTPVGAVVRELGGDAIEGYWSTSNAIFNFTPNAPLKVGVTYEVMMPAGAVTDQSGNPQTKPFYAKFSTGSEMSDFQLSLDAGDATMLGGESTFRVAAVGAGSEDILYAWDFGDGSQRTEYSNAAEMQYEFKAPGRYTVVVSAKHGERTASAVCTQLVVRPLTDSAPKHSATIAYDPETNRVWNVNPDNGTVTIVDGASLDKLAEIRVGLHPRTLSIAKGVVAVTDQDSAKLIVLDARSLEVIREVSLAHGSQPYGVVLSNSGKRAWVAGEATGVIFEVDCETGRSEIVDTLGHSLRGVALSSDERSLFVTRFRSGDTHAEVHHIDLETSVIETIQLAYDLGPDTEESGRGVPNYLSQIVISPDGSSAWVPSKKDNTVRGLFRDGLTPTFESTVRTIVSQIDLSTKQEVIANRQDFNDKDMANAAVYSPQGNLLFVAFQGVNAVDVIDAYTGEQLTSIIRVGAAPQGLAMNPNGTLYVHNFLDRTVVAFDVSAILKNGNGVATRLGTVSTVADEQLSAEVLMGKQIFYNAGNPQMSRDSYLSCASCHLDGGLDGRVWDFANRGEGLRNTISLQGRAGVTHGALHWSANFDEVQDFEHDIRQFFGGEGFLDTAMGNREFHQKHAPRGFPKAGQSTALDALAAYVSSLDSVPASPYRTATGDLTDAALRGRETFRALDCASCHGGAEFTDSATGSVHDVGTLRRTSGQRLGEALQGVDTPTLKGIWATAPYLHDGSAQTLREVLVERNEEQLHGKTMALDAAQLDDLIAYLNQIDETEPSAGAIRTPATSERAILLRDYNMIARKIDAAITAGVAIAPISGELPASTSLEQAYEIQNIFDQYMSRRVGSVSGYKMAFASHASQQKFGISEPVAGTFFKGQQVKSGGSVELDSFIGYHNEAEIAFILSKDIRQPVDSVEAIMPYIRTVHVGLDVPDLRFDKSKGSITAVDVVAMSCGTHTYVLGEGVKPEGLDYTQIQISLSRNGEIVYEGAATNVLGDPRESLRQLANRMIRTGRPLTAGQVILTGSVAGAYMGSTPEENRGHYIGEATGLPPVELYVE